jgi:hypothetical protein
MPVRIPFYEQQLTPQGRLEGYARGVQYSGAVGQAMEQAGNVMMRVGEQIDREVSEGQAREADNLASAEIRTLLYDPEKGYFAQVGKGAIEGYASTEQQIKAVQDKYSQNLSPRAKEMFSSAVNSRIQGALQSASSHVMNQSRVYNASQAEARRDMAVLDAISTAGGDPDMFRRIKATAIQEAQFGKDAAAAQIAVANTLTAMHKGIIDNFLSRPGGAQQAKDWYAANFNEIAPDARDDITKVLNVVDTRDQSLQLAFELQTVGGLREQEAELEKRYKAKSINAEVYDATRQRIRQEAQIRNDQQAVNKNAAIGLAQDWIIRNPGKALQDMPPELYAQMVSFGKLSGLANFQKTIQGDKSAQYDFDSYFALRRLAADNPSQFVKEWDQLSSEFREKLKPEHWSALTTIQSNILNNNKKGMDAVKIADDRMTKFDDTLRAAGLSPNSKNKKEAQQVSNFRGQYIDAIDAFMRDAERMPTNKEAEQIGYSLLKEIKTSETWYGRDVMEMAFETRSTPEYQEASNYLSSVNNERLARMGVQFGRNGMPIKDSSWDAAVIAVQQARENGELDF